MREFWRDSWRFKVFAMNDVRDPGAVDSAAQKKQKAAGVRLRNSVSRWLNPWVVVAALALLLAGWQWGETRWRLAETQQELARRLSESDAMARESRALAKQAQEQSAALLAKVAELEGKLAESRGQQALLEGLYQNLARSRDEWVAAEIEQAVTMAAQQLQVAGNVAGAILALQSAEARLAGSNRPQYVGLRRVLVRDLDRLRALPQIDVAGMSLRLESIIASVDGLPLAVDVRPVETKSVSPESGDPFVSAVSVAFWQQLVQTFWREVRGLVRIQRFDREEPALLAPGQTFFLRENLKLRLLNVRLSLLARDQWAFRREVAEVQRWMERYFDGRDKSVMAALATLRQFSRTEISSDLPTLTESLSALKSVRLGADKK